MGAKTWNDRRKSQLGRPFCFSAENWSKSGANISVDIWRDLRGFGGHKSFLGKENSRIKVANPKWR